MKHQIVHALQKYVLNPPIKVLFAMNVPDFLGPDAVEIAEVEVDGIKRSVADPHNFQIPLSAEDRGRRVRVRLRESTPVYSRLKEHAVKDERWP